MAKKKVTKKKSVKSKKVMKKSKKNIKQKIADKAKKQLKKLKISEKDIPTLKLKKESDIAMDFALKVYDKFEKSIKSIILFGSTAKESNVPGSDIDVIILLDDVTIRWDQELIAWYREELDRILSRNPYQKNLHINTIKLSTWWNDLINGDPVLINVLRYGQALIDLAGFFEPLKALLIQGKIKSTPEAVYTALQRSPVHLQRSKVAELNAIEGLYWSMVDSSQAALMAAQVPAPSPEHIPMELKTNFVDNGMLNKKYVEWMRDLSLLHKKIMHKEIHDLKGVVIDDWQDRTEEFLDVITGLIKDIIGE